MPGVIPASNVGLKAHRDVARECGFVAGLGLASAAPGRRHLFPQSMVRREHPVVAIYHGMLAPNHRRREWLTCERDGCSAPARPLRLHRA